MDCINLELLHGPQRRQEGSEQSCSERQLERGGSIAEICCTTCECAGVSGTEDGPSQGIATEIWVEAAADLQLEQPCGIKLCKETQKVLLWKKTNSKCENLRFTIITLGCFYFWLDFSLTASFSRVSCNTSIKRSIDFCCSAAYLSRKAGSTNLTTKYQVPLKTFTKLLFGEVILNTMLSESCPH